MEIVKYIFGNFWHWLGALIFLVIIIDGVIVNLFKVILVIIQKKKELPKHDPMDLPTIAPQGTIWPYDGKKYIFVKDTWIQISETLLNNTPSSTPEQ